jgi:Domain of unknown function (DUF397)
MQWRKSSFSANNGSCVEVAALHDQVATRDSKNSGGPILTFTRSAWAALIAELAQTG